MNSSPWAKFTTSMMPKISVSPEAISARIMPVTMPLIVWMRIWSNGMSAKKAAMVSISDSEILLDDGVADPELGRGRLVTDGAFFHQIDALACFQGQRHVL